MVEIILPIKIVLILFVQMKVIVCAWNLKIFIFKMKMYLEMFMTI